MENSKTDLVNKTKQVPYEFKNGIQKMGETLGQFSHDAGEKIGNMASNVSDSAHRYVDTSREYVKENPMKGLAIAAATGLVAGSLLTLALRRRSS